MIETIKASGAEQGLLERILGYQTRYDNARLELEKSRIRLGILPGLMAGFSNGIILILGIYAVFEGQQTIGTLAAFQAFLQLCFSPMTSFAQGLQAAQEMKGNVERVQDVLEYEDDPLSGGAALPETENDSLPGGAALPETENDSLPGGAVLPETGNTGRLTGRLCVANRLSQSCYAGFIPVRPGRCYMMMSGWRSWTYGFFAGQLPLWISRSPFSGERSGIISQCGMIRSGRKR